LTPTIKEQRRLDSSNLAAETWFLPSDSKGDSSDQKWKAWLTCSDSECNYPNQKVQTCVLRTNKGSTLL